jgi:hypothetical protein
LQRFSPALFLLFYFIIFASRLRLARSFSLNIFFSADNMFAAVPITSVRPAASQIIIGNNEAPPLFFKGRKLSLNGYKVNKTAPRLRHG